MYEKKISSLVFFGTSLRYLRDVQAGWNFRDGQAVIYNIKRFLSQLDEFELVVTKRASYELPKFKEELEKSDHDSLTEEEAKKLRDIMHKLRPTLLAEAGGKIAYIVSDKRFQIEKLMDDPGALFAKDIFAKLDDVARFDFSEAARCTAFERPTAAAFHLLRGTESVLRQYYCERIKRKRGSLMWGNMVTKLRSARKPMSVELLNHLDHIRNAFRNPTAHPEKIYDMDEAQDLFSICIDVVNRMRHAK